MTELARPFAMSQPAISKHPRVLDRAGLIVDGRNAQRRPRRLEARPLAEANEWLERYRRFGTARPAPGRPARRDEGRPEEARPPRRQRSVDAQVQEALTWLQRHANARTLAGMSRYGPAPPPPRVSPMADMKELAKRLGRSHDLAEALWDTGGYEARMLAALVDDPARVTPAQMDRWCRTSTTGASATRCASCSSTARRTRGRR